MHAEADRAETRVEKSLADRERQEEARAGDLRLVGVPVRRKRVERHGGSRTQEIIDGQEVPIVEQRQTVP